MRSTSYHIFNKKITVKGTYTLNKLTGTNSLKQKYNKTCIQIASRVSKQFNEIRFITW